MSCAYTLPAQARTLSYEESLREALRYNPGLAAAREQALVVKGETLQTLRPYDPRLVAESNYSEFDNPNSNPFFSSQGNGRTTRLSLETELPLGAKISAGLSNLEFNDTTDRAALGPQAAAFAPRSPSYTTEFFFNYRQSLLKDLWWFSGINTIKAGLARIAAARFRSDRIVSQTLASVTQSYAAWIAAAENARIARSSWKEAQSFYKKTVVKYKQGIEETAELLQSESTLHYRRSQYLSARDLELDAKEKLWVALGREPAQAAEDASSPGEVPHQNWPVAASLSLLEKMSLEHRQDVKAVYSDVAQMEAFYKRAKSNALPDLALEYRFRDPGVYFTRSDSLYARAFHPNQTIALTLNMPLWPWLGPRGEVQAARARLKGAQMQLKQAELDLKREALAVWRGLKTAQELANLAQKRVSLEKRKMREISRRYKDGQISGRELLLNQDDYLRARQAKALARQALVGAKVQFLLTQGGLVESLLTESGDKP